MSASKNECKSDDKKGLNLSKEETEKFIKAFDDPEFRSLFASYVDEIQDPNNRKENEMYIKQLESEDKVPEGKIIIYPKAEFVVKLKKTTESKSQPNSPTDSQTEKMFINIVTSDKINAPTESKAAQGSSWLLPYSVGPPHMEKDSSDVNVTCFDCCFHPAVISISSANSAFTDVVVKTAIDGVELSYARMNLNKTTILDKDQYHVLKGVKYKNGQVPSMLFDKTDSQQVWNDIGKNNASDVNNSSDKPSKVTSSDGSTSVNKATNSNLNAKTSGGMFKKGFLNSSSSEVQSPSYGSNSSKVPTTLLSTSAALETKDKLLLPNQSALPASPANGQFSLIQEVTSDFPSRISSSVNGTEIPPVATSKSDPTSFEYTMTERGVFSFGDFPSLQSPSQPLTSRPKELVYRFTIPAAVKPAQIVLDVAKQVIKLSYLDLHLTSITLPYPIFDTQGNAKYDKKTKVLTVVLPVLPPVLVKNEASSRSSESNVDTTDIDNENAELEDINEEVKDSIKQDTRNDAVVTKNLLKSHQRWAGGALDKDEQLKSEQLKVEISIKKKEKLEAFKTQQEAQQNQISAQMQLKEVLSQQTKLNSELDTFSVSSNVSSSLESSSHIPCPNFIGARPGYIFTTAAVDESGVSVTGYFIDPKASDKSNTTRSADSLLFEPFEFACRETTTAIVMIVEAANIMQSSVFIECLNDSFHVSFSAHVDTKGKSTAVTSHGLSFTLLTAKVDPASMSYDVAKENMAILMPKQGASSISLSAIGSANPTTSDEKDEFIESDSSCVVTSFPYKKIKAAAAAAAAVTKIERTEDKAKMESKIEVTNASDTSDSIVQEMSMKLQLSSANNLFELF